MLKFFMKTMRNAGARKRWGKEISYELHHALTLSPRDDRRQAILARVSSLLEGLD